MASRSKKIIEMISRSVSSDTVSENEEASKHYDHKKGTDTMTFVQDDCSTIEHSGGHVGILDDITNKPENVSHYVDVTDTTTMTIVQDTHTSTEKSSDANVVMLSDIADKPENQPRHVYVDDVTDSTTVVAQDTRNTEKYSDTNVVMLSEVINKPENQSNIDLVQFFESESLAHQNGNRKRPPADYIVSPMNSGESDAEFSDQDPSYELKKKRRIMPVYPESRRSSSSSSTSSSSSSSSSSGSSSSSDSDSEDENLAEICPQSRPAPRDSNIIFNNSDTVVSHEQAIEVPGTSRIEQTEDGRSYIEEPEIGKKKGRKHTSDPRKWKQNINKVLRNTGRCYVSKKKVTVKAREMMPPCTDRCRLKCSQKFTNTQRQAFFDAYWNLGEVDKQRLFINSCLSNVCPRYKYTNAQRPRKSNKAFHFIMDDKPIRVCKQFFMGTLAISDRVIRTVNKKADELGFVHTDQRGKHSNHRTNDESLILDIKNFIDSIPRIESHYTRQTSSRQYIDGAKSITDLFKDFTERQKKNNRPFGKYCTFYKVFTQEYNISFYSPRKDQCDLCLQYANSNNEQKNLIREKYEQHLEEKTLSRQEKYNDRRKINDKNKVLVFDLQAVLQSPRGNTSAFYYKSKLNSYNLTVTLLNKKLDGQMKDAYSDVHCYFWNETDANRGANEIGSCLLDCFEKISQESNDGYGLNLILYSDNCTGQNKNKYIVTLYLYAVTHLNIESITHKFLIKGHTQNEADNIHSLIEKEVKKNLKSGPIYSPHQYVTIIKNAKKTGQKFLVHERTYDSFLDLKKLQEDWGYNFNETEDKSNLAWTDIKILKCEKRDPFAFFVKTSYKDDEFKKICLRNKRKKLNPLSTLAPVKAYVGKQELNENKKKDLKELINKNLIPNFYTDFYNTIL